ncbi:dihydrodipicolinate synthase family protein [Microbacterium sp. 18062]|uniref:dihydrodipicolinate synthase family protein n=1 Tax=Microbacterium sp. 18062 TaxID=2681410 RepID=UPI00135B14C1|nr:dihydrodipicolinate synthase family protein [Microbacterium sp. 18062]
MTLATSGAVNIMVTPFEADGALDTVSLERTATWAVEAGVSGVIPLGIMGEASKLTDAERDKVVDRVVAAASGRASVIPGCTGDSVILALARIRRAAGLGADAAMVAPPRAAQTPMMQLEYYTAVADQSPVPLVLQDEPVTTGVVMQAATLAALSRHENVLSIKVEQVPSPKKVSDILAEEPGALCFGGLGGLYLFEELERGAVGVMTGFAYPDVLAQVVALHRAGDRDAARERFYHWLPIIRYEAQLGVGGVSIRKQILAERGIIAHSTVRAPAPAADPLVIDEIRDMIRLLEASA